jgi:hypothetical protein
VGPSRFTSEDLSALLDESFPDHRPVTFSDVAAVVHRIQTRLDAIGMPVEQQREYVTYALRLPALLTERAVFGDDPRRGRALTSGLY